MSPPNHLKGTGGRAKPSARSSSASAAAAASKSKKVSGNTTLNEGGQKSPANKNFRIPKNPPQSSQSAASNSSRGYLATLGPLSDQSGARPGTPRLPLSPNLGLFGRQDQYQNLFQGHAKVLPPPRQLSSPAAAAMTTSFGHPLRGHQQRHPRPWWSG